MTYNQKLTDKDVEEIRRLYTTTALTQTELAKRYNVSQVVVSRTIRRLTHKKAK